MSPESVQATVYKIESGIPIPERKYGAVNDMPFGELKVGQSFFTENKKSITSRVSYAAKKHGMKYTTRAVDGGVRIWRIA